MNELKPEDVMRALECCTQGPCWCKECPIGEGERCITRLAEATLALLREKDAEIERLRKERDLANAEREANVKGFTTEVEKMTIEIEALKIANEKMYAENKAQEAEIEGFNDCIAEIQKNQAEVKYLKHAIRSEAITEFADRIIRFYNALPGKTVGGSVEYHVKQVRDAMLKEAEK